jgi:gliding motility-associated-like protein
MRVSYYFMTLVFCSIAFIAHAQDKSNRGKEFWLGYGFNYSFLNEPPVNTQELALYISTESAATVTISINGTGWSQTLNIPANTVDASILIPKNGVNDARVLTDGLSTRGIHIVSTVPVAVYAHVYANQLSGATMLMPVETYGYSYYSVNYYQTTSQSNPPDWYSWFYVIASEDNTKVVITPSDSTKNGWLPNQQYTVTLNKGEMYHVFGKAGAFNTNNYALCSKDMTGSKVVSVPGSDGKCHPIAMFSGSGGIRLCRGDGGEFMHQQVFPLQAWGTRYLTYHTINNTNTDLLPTNRNLYRICVQDPATVVKKNGIVLTGLTKNFFYEYMDSTGGDYIESDKPILVSQYMVNKNQCWNYPTSTPSPPSYGDPEMFYLSPIEQGQKSVLFYTSRKSTIDYVYVNIFLPASAIASLKVDGATLPSANIIAHPNNPLYAVAIARFIGAATSHSITCDSAINATVYGLGNYESYGYNVGTYINNLNHYSEIKNTNNTSGVTDTFSCPNTPLRIFLKLGFPATKIHWKLSQVTGITPNTDSIINNPVPFGTELINGRTYYVYTLQQDFQFAAAGSYTIPVTYESILIENCSQSEEATVNVLIKAGPDADFNISANTCMNDTLAFTGIVNAAGFTIASYKWTFADNSTQATINAKKRFAAAGIQDVSFKAYASNGCLAEKIKQVTILPAPAAGFNVVATACAGTGATITDNSTITGSSISTWQWNFGDGNNVINNNSASFTHTYNNGGSYTISMVAVAANGCKSDSAKQPITILPKPFAGFGTSANICAGDSIRFTDNSTPPAGGTLTSWNWNFGDANSASFINNSPFYHPYTSAGNYTVKLVVKANNGCNSDTASKPVVVASKPTVSFTITGKPCVDSTFSFTSSVPVTAIPTTWHWVYGDGQTNTSVSSNSSTHVYPDASSNITVKHAVDFAGGCGSDTVTATIPLISANPTVSLDVLSDTFCTGKPVRFNGSASQPDITWLWNFGNGTLTAPPPVQRTYNSAGSFGISLAVVSTGGCGSAPATSTIIIHPLPQVNAGTDKIINLGNSVIMNAVVANVADHSYLWTPPAGLSDPQTLNPMASPGKTTTYLLTATDIQSFCSSSDNVTINVITKLEIPNAFSPNKDGINDKWTIKGMDLYPDAIITIYSRYGQKIFESYRYYEKPWDGTNNGKDLPAGVYYYLIKPSKASSELLSGSVTVLR